MYPAITPNPSLTQNLVTTYYVGSDQVILLGQTALVSSKSEPGKWREVDAQLGLCGCPGYAARGRCRHVDAVKVAMEQDRATATPVERPMCQDCGKKPALVICGRQTSKCGCCTFAAAMGEYDSGERTGYAPNH